MEIQNESGDRNFAKIVAPPRDKNNNYVVHLKDNPFWKTLKTSSKSAYKR